jgi:tripartite-type tricarboxylate transporter receptor subunit TctC
MSFYQGKTITFIAPDKPGGSFDLWSRLLAQYLGQYLKATVNVENVPPGNTIVGQNQLAASAPDGLTIGWINAGEDVADQVKGVGGVNFNPANLSFVGAPGFGQLVFVAQTSAPYKTFQSLSNATAAKPVTSLDVTKGTGDTVERVILGAYGIHAKIITGYASSKDLGAGYLRGDGQIAEEELAVFQDAITSGHATPLLVTAPVPPQNPTYSQMKNVPTLQQLYAQDPPPTSQGKAAIQVLMSLITTAQDVVAPTGVPTARLAALRAAMKWAFQQSSLKSRALQESLTPTYYSGPQAQANYKLAQTKAQSLKSYLAGT